MSNALHLSCGTVRQLYYRVIGVHLDDADSAVVVADGLHHGPGKKLVGGCGVARTAARGLGGDARQTGDGGGAGNACHVTCLPTDWLVKKRHKMLFKNQVENFILQY